MADDDFLTFDQFDDEDDVSQPIGRAVLGTETIDADSIFLKDITASGSFDLRGIRSSALGKLLQSLPIPAFLIAESGSIVFANKSSEDLSGGNRMTGISFPCLLPRTQDQARLRSIIEQVFTERKPQVTEGLLTINEKRIWGRIHLRSLRMGVDRSVLVLMQDLTPERMQLLLTQKHQKELQEARDKLELRVLQRTAELTAINERLEIEIADRKRAEEELREARDQLERRVEERTADLVETNAQLTVQIAQRQGAEQALQKSEGKFRTIFQHSLDVIVVLDGTTGRIISANQALKNVLGYEPEAFVGNHFSALIPDEPNASAEDLLERLHVSDAVFMSQCVKNHAGALVPMDLTATLIPWEGSVAVLATFRDVTDRKKAEEALLQARAELERRVKERTAELVTLNQSLAETEGRQKAILDNIPDIAWLKDKESKFIAVNQPLAYACGLKPQELVGKTDFDIWPPDPARRNHMDDLEVMRSRAAKRVEEPIMGPDGAVTWLETIKTPIFNERGEVIGTTGIARDITRRKLAHEQLCQSLREKEALLQEVHHRVKNNLQIISSLLALQRSHVNDDETVGVLKDSQSRIRSMAFIHEQLYQAKDLNRIDFQKYIRDLTSALFRSYSQTGSRVALKLGVDPVSLGVGTALPCGLIINELVSNSLKHAFPDDTKGSIRVELLAQGPVHRYVLLVADDGIGLPADLDYLRSKSLGLRLVTNLTELQLRGTLTVLAEKGTQVRIEFEDHDRPKVGDQHVSTEDNDR